MKKLNLLVRSKTVLCLDKHSLFSDKKTIKSS